MFRINNLFLSMLSMEKTSFVYRVLLLIVFIVCLALPDQTQKNVSCFSFIHTDTKSPMMLEDTCFEISDNTTNSMYTGIFLDVIKSSCKYYDMQLEDVKKYIVEDSHQRPLCRIRMTMSIDTTQCTETIAIIQHFCKQPKSIYFQDCFPVNCPSTNKKKINGELLKRLHKQIILCCKCFL
ncbi:uncharacterized protein LOC130048283 [Ostrea edulis]|uniref:uncharacterized protein LOC130048283 n=1 Tax=Ostrea edulis TaxID=37623 RepID=UPI0024AF22B3|nr:uncharacterized protein LOC130048283 [Ostrea edulis]